MTGRARGRARGRACGAAAESAPRPGGGPPQLQGAWQSRQPQQPQQQQPKPPSQSAAQAANAGNGGNGPPSSGRASHRGGARGEPRPGGEAVQGAEQAMARMSLGTREAGGHHQRREVRYVEPNTRPAHIVDKKGASGAPIPLISNYFKLEAKADWNLYQYHVDYAPEVDSKRMRLGMMRENRELVGDLYAFDGMTLFLPYKLEEDKTEVFAKRISDDENIRITITRTAELPQGHPTCIHMYNIIFKKCLTYIDMKQIGRNYFSPSLAVTIPQYKLEVWPGFITSILQYESSVMLCADISHKILRQDTVLDFMYELYQNCRGDFHDICTKQLVGQIVLTRYNNKTYRVDDIQWDKHPTDTFAKGKDSTEITFQAYYEKHHNIKVSDPQQPLLVSLPKKSDIRRGQTGPILLLPELCTMTGLSEEMRSNFHVMKDVANHTRLSPDERNRTLLQFSNKLNTNADVKKHLDYWQLSFKQGLVPLTGRIMPPKKKKVPTATLR